MGLNSNKKCLLIDQEFFESRRQIGEDFIRKLVEVFSQEAPKLILSIKETVEKKNKTELAKLGHKLKGMCLNVGASALSQLGREIEMNAHKIGENSVTDLINRADRVFEGTLSEMNSIIE